MAAALSLTFGRGGALIGNLVFGFLIDLNCVVPIVLFAAMLFSKYRHQTFYFKTPLCATCMLCYASWKNKTKNKQLVHIRCHI